MSKAKSTPINLTVQQQEQLTKLCVAYDMMCQGMESIGYGFHQELESDYQQMSEVIYLYMDKLNSLIDQLKALKNP